MSLPGSGFRSNSRGRGGWNKTSHFAICLSHGGEPVICGMTGTNEASTAGIKQPGLLSR
jgi:hypothetical protein